MTISHPTEVEIQQYSADKAACPATAIFHIENCKLCQRHVVVYQSVISGIREQQKPSFDFDLSGIVLAQLQPTSQKLRADRFVAGFLICFILCCIGLPLYLFRFYILNMFSGIPPFFIYSILACSAIIIVLKGLELYRKYKKQIEYLNFN